MKLDMRKKQEKKETTKSTKKLPMTAKMKQIGRASCRERV